MNTLIVGLPGNGKGLKGMQLLVDELRLGTRPVITNLAVEKWPWVTNKHKPERGLISYLQETYSDDFNCVERIFRVSDEAIQNFYLYRALSRAQVKKLGATHLVGYRQVTALDGVLDEQELHTHKDFQLYVCDHQMTTDKNLRKHCQSFNAVLLEHSGPHLNIADECWKFWPARGWQSTSEADVFYNAQHRHFGDDNLYLTQRHNDIDSIIVERCQNSIVMTHHGKMSLGIFRQPDLFSESVYQGRPMPSKEPMSRRVFRLDVKGLGGGYDTSAGVGITGRSAADVGGRKIKGLPFWMMPVAVLLVLFMMGYTIKFGASFVVGALNGKRKPVAQVVAPGLVKTNAVAAVPAQAPEKNLPARKVADGFQISGEETKEVTCCGWATDGKFMHVFLSDGREASSEFGEVEIVRRRSVRAFGQVFRVEPRPAVSEPMRLGPVTSPDYVRSENNELPGNEERSIPNVLITPGISGIDPGRPPSLNGIQNLQQGRGGYGGGNYTSAQNAWPVAQ